MRLDALRRRRVVVLPDVYIDALCPLPAWKAIAPRLDAIAQRGGGNLPVDAIQLKAGGNAGNLAVALARLGAHVDLVAETDAVGHLLLQKAAQGTRLGLEHVRIGETTSATLALECRGANVMLSHAGPLQSFGPERLTDDAWGLLERADAVAVVNWAQNQRGTALWSTVAKRVGDHAFVYLDSGDPRHRGAEARRLVRPAAWWRKVGAFGMNPNELAAFTGRELGPAQWALAAQQLGESLGTRIDLHCRQWAGSFGRGPLARVRGLAGRGRRATGAGDAWNAGNLAGQLLGLSGADRLRLAHHVATQFVLSRDGRPPTAAQVHASWTSTAGAAGTGARSASPGKPTAAGNGIAASAAGGGKRTRAATVAAKAPRALAVLP